MENPRMIQNWPVPPGKHGTQNKVPSTILYQDKHKVGEWGFTCGNHRDMVEWFKTLLEEESLKSMLVMSKEKKVTPLFSTVEEVREIYGDYMKCLYQHISRKLQEDNKSWKRQTVEFAFSLPPAFGTIDVSNALMEHIKRAGFGSGGKRHRVLWGLSEPQASAVYTAKKANVSFKKKDIILVCDAGGGTTDLALLRQEGTEDLVSFTELSISRGNMIGSTDIDRAFEEMVEERLSKAKDLSCLNDAANIMMHSDEFQTWKHSFGKIEESQFGMAKIPVPIILEGTITDEAAGVSDGKMKFSHEDFCSLFDPQVDDIITSIKLMIDEATDENTGNNPDYLVLSGGLGSSAYVWQRVKEAFPNLKVIVAEADEPQLAVAKGLVLDRMHMAKLGKAALRVRKARASYGVVTRERYDKRSHSGKQPTVSTLDGELWIEDEIKWVIRKGNNIDAEQSGKNHGFSRAFTNRGKPGIVRRELVICHNDKDRLPTSRDNADIFTLCHIESDLSKIDSRHIIERQGRKPFWKFWRKALTYYEIKYAVKFVIGSMDARFEIWIGDQEYAKKNSFKVDWENEGTRSSLK
ncbi:hypothetical protein ANO14919_035260 [Xylariales sp. No.14919]|nr:hypothetical protein ANO14919_035260 [Xylariales sp. No.14919]